jgi:hypothetical protein
MCKSQNVLNEIKQSYRSAQLIYPLIFRVYEI